MWAVFIVDIWSPTDTATMMRAMADWLAALALLLLTLVMTMMIILFATGVGEACARQWRMRCKSRTEVVFIEDSPMPTKHSLSLSQNAQFAS